MKLNTWRLFIMLIVLAFLSGCWSDTAKKRPSDDREDDKPRVNSKETNTNGKTGDTNSEMKNPAKKIGFTANLPDGFSEPTDEAGRKLLKEYGSFLVAKGGAIAPKTVVFRDAAEVSSFQSGLSKSTEKIGGFDLELQAPAMKALKEAIDDAKSQSLTITPRDKDSARRSYDETVSLWSSRVEPALKHWVSKGKVTQAEANRIKSLSPYEQVPEVFKLEAQGIYFAKDLSKSIIYSVAPPGTSQHLAMLAFDVNEHENSKVREILAKHGWYQTVISDLPHFTYLGVPESELAALGLKKTSDSGRTFWIPEI